MHDAQWLRYYRLYNIWACKTKFKSILAVICYTDLTHSKDRFAINFVQPELYCFKISLHFINKWTTFSLFFLLHVVSYARDRVASVARQHTFKKQCWIEPLGISTRLCSYIIRHSNLNLGLKLWCFCNNYLENRGLMWNKRYCSFPRHSRVPNVIINLYSLSPHNSIITL